MLIVMLAAATTHADPITFDQAAAILFDGKPPSDCSAPDGGSIDCLIDKRYAKDDKAKKLARDLYRDTGDVAGVGADQQMDGGYRGKIHLVPELPVGDYRQHLAWVAAAMKEIDTFFTAFPTSPSYRWRDLRVEFVRSVGKRTPSAYAGGWIVTYNVSGSLMTSDASVLETLFHELFHDNDEAHGDWSAKALTADYDAIVNKCGTKMKCLAPYAPNSTVVRGGTYYAFQPDNGNTVHEYAAELAVRYFDEQREMKVTGKLGKPAFKCGPAENGRAWRALVDEFFAGRDLVPSC